ncbi:hypothetical protein [Psychrobacter sp. NPDC077938]|uniref:hypothetical protein n=1 Tax=Psychrobacter sp. NPDC077938 TaxID=3364494 RepID=UPI0037C9310B
MSFNLYVDISQQIFRSKSLPLARQLENTDIINVVLIDSQLDHVTGLLTLCEGCSILVQHTNMVYQNLTTRVPFLIC